MVLPMCERSEKVFLAIAVEVDWPEISYVLEVEHDLQRAGRTLQQLQQLVPRRPRDLHVIAPDEHIHAGAPQLLLVHRPSLTPRPARGSLTGGARRERDRDARLRSCQRAGRKAGPRSSYSGSPTRTWARG